MGKYVKRGLLALILLLVAAQFVPVERSNPSVETEVPAPPEVKALLRQACYDCHSHETVWPAYSRVAPISWFLASHVREARGELNFSTWNQYDARRLAGKMEEMGEVLAEGEMPLWSYTLLHPQARLTPGQRATLQAWAKSMGGEKGEGGQ